jgi:glycosyltransferase involved in cell wall biosynthesis
LHPSDVHVAVVSQNADLATDLRPLAMAGALADAGYVVTLVGPAGDRRASSNLAGPAVTVRSFEPPEPATDAPGQVREQALATFRAARELVKTARAKPIHVIHAGNPPDNGWLFPRLLRVAQRFAPAFVYDHHDPAPLLVADKFGNSLPMRALASILRRIEARSFQAADLTVLANEAFLTRGQRLGLVRGASVVVPNGWSLPGSYERRVFSWRDPRRPLVTYVGATNAQDCISHLVQALALLNTRVQTVIAGDGDARSEAERLAQDLGVGDRIVWLGWVRDRELIAQLVADSTVCVAPETPSPANDISSFVKVIEYLSLGAPVVAHRLAQTELLAGDTIEYAADFSASALAAALERLLADPARGRARAQSARRRFDETLRWETVGRPRLVDGYERFVLPKVADVLQDSRRARRFVRRSEQARA